MESVKCHVSIVTCHVSSVKNQLFCSQALEPVAPLHPGSDEFEEVSGSDNDSDSE